MSVKFVYSKNPENSLMTEQDCVTLKHVGFEQKFQNLNPSENVIKGGKITIICCVLVITCRFFFLLYNYLVLNNVLIFLMTMRPN